MTDAKTTPPMDLTQVHKKLREAAFFLDKLRGQEPVIFGDKEPFHFYLSAYLSAARSVILRLEREHVLRYNVWRKRWHKTTLNADQYSLMIFMADERNYEVHESSPNRIVGEEGVKLPGGTHSRDGAIFTHSGPAGTESVVSRPTYSFTKDGNDVKVTKACAEYLELLQQMVAEFEAAQSSAFNKGLGTTTRGLSESGRSRTRS
jgi:hypothetical protein